MEKTHEFKNEQRYHYHALNILTEKTGSTGLFFFIFPFGFSRSHKMTNRLLL